MITAALVKELREKTGAGMMDCKKALTECDGDIAKSIDWLREKGIAKAAKKKDVYKRQDLVKSQEARRMLDRIIGFKLSKLLQSKIKSKSAGRVQSVALRLIVERENEIRAFKSEEYWTLAANIEKDGKMFSASLNKIDGKKADLKTQEEMCIRDRRYDE